TFLTQVGLFFSKLAVVTFGGAYAVLAYMTQEVVSDKAWLSTAQMVDGLGLAETTPGPLILVTEFVGFQAGFGAGGIGLALAAAALTLWVTFVPCFLWIFTGAPYIEFLAQWPRLASGLRAITAAIVGVILNLSVWFGLHVLFGDVAPRADGLLSVPVPRLDSVDWLALGIAVLAAWLLIGRGLGVAAVLAIAAAVSVAVSVAVPLF
ncbi:MAG: chromate transporter, partial [Halocynthiibacter sp.]